MNPISTPLSTTRENSGDPSPLPGTIPIQHQQHQQQEQQQQQQIQHQHQHQKIQPPSLASFTYEQYLQLPDSVKDQHDLVSGLLTYNPKMADVEHIDIVKSLTFYLIKSLVSKEEKFHVYSEAQLYIPSRKDALQKLLESSPTNSPFSSPSKSPCSSPSSSSSRSSISSTGSGEGKRRSDICVFDREPVIGSDGFFDKDCPPKMIIEVTSDQSSRDTDFGAKWRQYFRSGVDEYIIVDRDKPHVNKSNYYPCVIVGKRKVKDDEKKYWSLASSGHPNDATNVRIRDRSASGSRYYKRVFDEYNENIVECSYLNLQAKDMLGPPKMEALFQDNERQMQILKKENERLREVENENEQVRNENKQVRKENEQVRNENEWLREQIKRLKKPKNT